MSPMSCTRACATNFSEEQLMQLGGQIAFENYRARWNRIFNIESDNVYQGPADS